MDINEIKKYKNRDGFSEIDLQFAEFITKMAQEENYLLFLTSAMTSWALRNDHICMDLKRFASSEFPIYTGGAELASDADDELQTFKLPGFDEWKGGISGFAQIISRDRETPLILDEYDRVYLHKYWNFEMKLAGIIVNHHKTDISVADNFTYSSLCSCSSYFKEPDNELNLQKLAIFTSLINNFVLITGGPGTGKTTIVSVILSMMLDKNPNLNIKLCAPTGKAAGRLRESISDEIKNISPAVTLTTELLEGLESYTVHRLLGYNYLSPNFKHDENNKLKADVLVIDEASMISLSMFHKLFKAVSQSTKVIILGDKDQLASVEAGAVLANIYDAGTPNRFSSSFIKCYNKFTGVDAGLHINNESTPLSDCIVELKKSYRFDDNEGIGLIKNAVHNVDSTGVDIVMDKAKELKKGFVLHRLPKSADIEEKLTDYVNNLTILVDGEKIPFKNYINASTAEEAYSILSEFKILCSHNLGRYGVSNINNIIHKIVFGRDNSSKGLPILIKENSRQLELYNGDIGILWPDENNIEKAYFPQPGTSKLKPVQISVLPAYNEVFAMTVHKSQGSGFQNVLIILPEKDSPLLTRELIYTGITRAKKYCELWANDDVFKASVLRKTERDSGLKDQIASISLYNDEDY